jgi:ketosteroid isomerase-like protein
VTARLFAVGLAVSIAACTAVGPSPDRSRIDGLANAERAFAAAAATSGVKAAFLGAMGDDTTLFRPGPVNGKTFVSERPEAPFQLAWQPQRVAVSASDDLGYSSGPSKVTLSARPDDPLYGQFFSVWRRGSDGRWTLLFDHGIGNPGPSGWTVPFEALTGDGTVADRPVAAAEADFNRVSTRESVGAAYRALGSARLRILRDDVAPIDGISNTTTMPDGDARWDWTSIDRGTSQAGDFAWTLGRYRAAAARDGSSSGFYVRVWRAENGDWKILGDLLAPIKD